MTAHKQAGSHRGKGPTGSHHKGKEAVQAEERIRKHVRNKAQDSKLTSSFVFFILFLLLFIYYYLELLLLCAVYIYIYICVIFILLILLYVFVYAIKNRRKSVCL